MLELYYPNIEMVNVQLYQIAPHLAPYVRQVWSLDLSLDGDAVDLRMTADCYPHLVIRCEHSADGLWLPGDGIIPTATLKGISTQSITYKMSPKYSHIAVSFYPNAIKNLLGIDACETVDQLISAEHIFSKDMIEQIIIADSHFQRAQLINSLLTEKLLKRHSYQSDRRTADFLLNHKDAYHKKLSDYNISERHFRRLFYSEIGLSPTFYKRLYRFESILTSIRNDSFESLTELAYQFEYADQSHFCKEFKAFTGESPHSFIKKDRIFEDRGLVERPDDNSHFIGALL